MVYVLWLSEGFEDDRILCAYYSKKEAEEHCDRLSNMTTYLDECSYKVVPLVVS